jgi:hypothetical protein
VLYELAVKLLGLGIASTLHFLPPEISFNTNEFFIHAHLNEPITSDIQQLVQRGFVFRIEYSYTIIINDRRTYTATAVKNVMWKNSYTVNDSAVSNDQVQNCAGSSSVKFGNFKFDEGDKVFIYIKAHVLPDKELTQSTGLPTGILWSYYVPRIKSNFCMHNGVFVSQ